MKKALLTGIAVLFLSTGAANACACCVIVDPTGTPLNVRDKPGGSIIDTIPNPNDVVLDYYEKLEKDNRGRLWAWVNVDAVSEGGIRYGWVFYKYLRCG